MIVSALAVGLTCLAADTVEVRRPSGPMFERAFAGGWRVVGMGQAVPVATVGRTSPGDTPLDAGGAWLTQVVGMIDVESPGARWTLRITPNLEPLTLAEGELTYGGWGEGFIDRRHPHTLLHEAMISVNLWAGDGGGFSLSAGKGFAPYGTEDPMSRPVLKYPTNHHLSQILERFTLNATVLHGPWSVEAGVFGGTEPTGPYDFSNVTSFGDSWSVRVTRRFGAERMGAWRWEVAGSYGSVGPPDVVPHVDEGCSPSSGGTVVVPFLPPRVDLVNGQVRFDGAVGGGRLYGLVEASASQPWRDEPGYWSILGEARVSRGRHQPYARLEVATRPEYTRRGRSAPLFFRYGHHAAPRGSTDWTIATVGYGVTATTGTVSVRPFVEGQWFDIGVGRAGADPQAIYGADTAWSVSVGARIFLGGTPMRMGPYGVLDPMTRMGRTPMGGRVHH